MTMTLGLSKSQSLPGLMKLGTVLSGPARLPTQKVTLGPEQEAILEMLKNPTWRFAATDPPRQKPPEDVTPANIRYPADAPAWMKHDKQVLRFYGYFQEQVTERPDENSRFRHVAILYHMEDGTVSIMEPRIENSGIPQGVFLKRHIVTRDDGRGTLGPEDFRIGVDISIYSRVYHISGCDRFTRWFYQESGIDLGEDEPKVVDSWEQSYKFKKVAEKGGLPLSRSAWEAKTLTKFQVGQQVADKKFVQFLLNDRKVLRFKAFWDDHTMYGARIYFVIHYYLADNTVEINEAHCRNSGRDNYPVFMRRSALYKDNSMTMVPGMLTADPQLYLPEDFRVGEPIYVWRRKIMLYDCDEFTRAFYMDYMNHDQFQGRLDVSEKPIRHVKLAPPPHNGIGSEEDSLISCKMIQPKAPKQDLVKLMTLSGEVVRFEGVFANPKPEHKERRFIIAYYPADEQISVFELKGRNNGHQGGKYAEKRRMKNVDAGGRYFELSDFYIGATVTLASQGFVLQRADEHALRYLEERPDQFPHADPFACAAKLAPLKDCQELRDPAGVDPDVLKDLAARTRIALVDHEVVTLLRAFGVSAEDPRMDGVKMLQAVGAA